LRPGESPEANSPKIAAVYTPYNVVAGGGERYLLSAALAFQSMGYFVHLLVDVSNTCRSTEDALQVISRLNIPLDTSRLEFHRVISNVRSIQAPRKEYDLFFLLGNEKVPEREGLGLINFYMCQFPFDLDRPVPQELVTIFSGYHYVLLNSGFSHKHYAKYTEESIRRSREMYTTAPQAVVLHPPFTPSESGGADVPVSERKHVVMLGRFFSGRQNKGHFAALGIWRDMASCVPEGTWLHMIGTVMPGEMPYVEALQREVDSQGLRVQLHLDASLQDIHDLMGASLVQWHLTGVDADTSSDPASEEHFGVAVVEGMSAGVIPVVMNRGGLPDIVTHNVTGFLADSAGDVANLTCGIFRMPPDDISATVAAVKESSKRFEYGAFEQRLTSLARRGLQSIPYMFFLKHSWDEVTCRQFSVPAVAANTAVLVEMGLDFRVRFVVKNVLHHLGGAWGLTVLHGPDNGEFVRRELEDVAGTAFVELEVGAAGPDQLSRALLGSSFWRSGPEKFLIFNTDSLLLHGNISPFLGYDSVTAPLSVSDPRRQAGSWPAFLRATIGRAGLSLQSARMMQALAGLANGTTCSPHNRGPLPYCLATEHSELHPASRGEAYRFVLEAPCKELQGISKESIRVGLRTLPHVPFGLNAAWHHMAHPVEMKDLRVLLDLSVC